MVELENSTDVAREQRTTTVTDFADVSPPSGSHVQEAPKGKKNKWSFGILQDSQTDEVPGSVLLLSKSTGQNAPLGLQNTPARTSMSSLPSPYEQSSRSQAMFGSQTPRQAPGPRTPSRRTSRPRHTPAPEKKRTSDGKIILEPQPEESKNDPLNWSARRRDISLLCLGFYCMIGGGMTPILAAGFSDVSEAYDVSIPDVALTTGLYMLGLGIGSVIASPTAITFGKRPVYLVTSILFALTSVWCALSPNFPSLVVARIVQGLAVSPVECLPSATIAEIFFLHERAYRLGIYTLLLLGGKNLIPLVSAAIIEAKGWRWVFWVVAIVVGACFFLLFFFVPETFWDRSPQPHKPHKKHHINLARLSATISNRTPAEKSVSHPTEGATNETDLQTPEKVVIGGALAQRREQRRAHFASTVDDSDSEKQPGDEYGTEAEESPSSGFHETNLKVSDNESTEDETTIAAIRSPRSPPTTSKAEDYFGGANVSPIASKSLEDGHVLSPESGSAVSPMHYTKFYREAPTKTYIQTLKPYSGRLTKDNWFRVAFRPFILFAYPCILWSAAVYALSVGWLIVLSESVAAVYQDRHSYNFNAIGTGLVYISPFVGGILGTAVAGKVSDLLVRFMARRNDGVYEPEFRLIMAIPVTICTVIGLMGFGWSAEERDAWIVPTVFFGIISFGCTLGSTTAITFAVDSYRQYAGEALVTLNFSKNVLHGFVFSLFFNKWLESEGPKDVFIALGGIQIFFLLWTIPMYIYGKRLRMWTVRRNLMEKF